ncbi:MAG: dihydrodipicolinate synthase family protein [Alphaproteobacteria bacterium]|nr:dihydrodipicolinate synthase family protein [Alphaproteobacteria bacterium]
MLTEAAKGVYIIAATPFRDDGALDLDGVDRLVDFYLSHGVTGITILGMMGEAPKLTGEESTALVRRFIARAGRVPVVVGVSSPGLAALKALAQESMAAGAAGVMVAPTPGLRGDDGFFAYFEQVFAALGSHVPVVLQDYPQATQVYMPVSVFNRLVDAFPQLVMLKHEDCPGLAKLSRVRADARRDDRRRFSILTGNGGLYLPQELARGADGAMTGFAWPEMLVEVCDRFGRGDSDGAEDMFDAYLPLVRHEQQPAIGLALRKEVLWRRGAIASSRQRVPGSSLGVEDRAELDRLIDRLNRRLAAMGRKPALTA